MPNGEVKAEPPAADPAAPKKCDVIVISGRKERCEAAVEALKVRGHPLLSDWLGGRGRGGLFQAGGWKPVCAGCCVVAITKTQNRSSFTSS